MKTPDQMTISDVRALPTGPCMTLAEAAWHEGPTVVDETTGVKYAIVGGDDAGYMKRAVPR